MVVNADNCYFNVLEKKVFKNNTITIELGLKEYISNINNAKLFLESDENALELNNKKILVNNGWNTVTAICMVVFCLFHFPCSTTLLTIKDETKSLKWTVLSFFLPLIIGIILCLIINFIL